MVHCLAGVHVGQRVDAAASARDQELVNYLPIIFRALAVADLAGFVLVPLLALPDDLVVNGHAIHGRQVETVVGHARRGVQHEFVVAG